MSSQGRHFIKSIRGQSVISSPQRNKLRLPDIEQALEYEDSSIDVHRYPSHVKAPAAESTGWTQSKRVGY